MDISTALAADLAALTETLDPDAPHDADPEMLLRAFTDAVRSAVNSYLGMSLSIVVNGYEISFTTPDAAGSDAATSLLIPLAALVSTSESGRLLLYAARSGAFVDLAADLSDCLGPDHTMLVLDQHLTRPVGESGMAGLDAYSTINRAIGVLIADGHTPESAHKELHRRASED